MICRYCKTNLSKGDIYEVLKDAYGYTEEKIIKMAKQYGWTPDNKIHFSREVIVQFDDRHKPQVQICPDCKGISPTDKTAPREYLQT